MPGVTSFLSITRTAAETRPPAWRRAAESGSTDDSGEAAEDLRLLRAGQAGDRAALERLLTRYEAPLYHLTLGILGQPSEAEDAVQETFLRGLRALGTPSGFRGEAAVRTWIFRIAINVCLEWRRARRLALSLEDLPFDLPGGGPSLEDAAVRRLRVRDAFRTLQPRHRALILLKEMEGWSVAEIAPAFGWNEKKVHNELFKARRALADWRDNDSRAASAPFEGENR